MSRHLYCSIVAGTEQTWATTSPQSSIFLRTIYFCVFLAYLGISVGPSLKLLQTSSEAGLGSYGLMAGFAFFSCK